MMDSIVGIISGTGVEQGSMLDREGWVAIWYWKDDWIAVAILKVEVAATLSTRRIASRVADENGELVQKDHDKLQWTIHKESGIQKVPKKNQNAVSRRKKER